MMCRCASRPGKVLALLGPNGAGKTTLIRVLTTLLAPDSGQARVAGHDVVKDAKTIRSLIGLAGQYASVDELLTGRENLELVGLLYHLDRSEYQRRAQEALERMTLTDAGDKPVKTYSGGMRRRLDLAASLIGQPPVLFLDEPTTGLDPRTRNDLWQFIKDLVAEGTTVLLTTQYMEEAEHLADDIIVIDDGRRRRPRDTSDELKDRLGGDVLCQSECQGSGSTSNGPPPSSPDLAARPPRHRPRLSTRSTLPIKRRGQGADRSRRRERSDDDGIVTRWTSVSGDRRSTMCSSPLDPAISRLPSDGRHGLVIGRTGT